MADQMKATPRSPILGLFSDIVNLPLQYMSSPERTQQMQGTAQFLYGTGIPQTLERASYGDSLFTGAGMTLRPKEETINAAMNVAPFAPAVGRLASRAVRATEGMPVGMSIKDVSYRGSHLAPNAKTYGATLDDLTKILPEDVYSQQGKQLYGLGDRLIDSEWRIAALKARGKPNAEVEIFRAVPKGVKDINNGDWVSTSKAYAKQHGESTLNGEYEIISKKVPAKTLSTEGYPYEYGYNTNFEYPQQAALDLAQQRAALPVEQGGLGLPANNTAEMRAQAMGFDVNTPLYHATDVDFGSIRPSLQGKLGAGVYVSPSSKYAEKYTSLNSAGNARVLPLVARGTLADDDVAMNIAESIRQEMATQNPNFSVAEWKKRTTQALADAGYAGRNMSGLESVITDPSNVRSRFAAFDPFRKDVATATAMGVALPDLLAQPVSQYPQSYETIPMYTDPFGNTIGSSIR